MPQNVLTAAHSMRVMGVGFKVVKAVIAHHDNVNTAGYEIYAKRSYVHPKYDSDSMKNDVAILVLESEYPDWAKMVSKVSFYGSTGGEWSWLNTTSSHSALPEDFPDLAGEGAALNVSGWGTLESGGETTETLQTVRVFAWTNEQCSGELGYGENADIKSTMLCAGNIFNSSCDEDGGPKCRDSCQGDSGRPLFAKAYAHDSSSFFVVVGIVSWGYGCADGYPGVYTRVSEVSDFILNFDDDVLYGDSDRLYRSYREFARISFDRPSVSSNAISTEEYRLVAMSLLMCTGRCSNACHFHTMSTQRKFVTI